MKSIKKRTKTGKYCEKNNHKIDHKLQEIETSCKDKKNFAEKAKSFKKTTS